MSEEQPLAATTAKQPDPPPLFLMAVCLLAFVSLAAVPPALLVLLALDLPVWLLAGAPLGVLLGVLICLNTHAGLCAAAFAIAPLTAFGREVAGVTISLPEVLMLFLFSKEALRFVLRRETIVPALPWRSLLFYLAGSALALLTGLRYGNGFLAALQDFRQFTEFILIYLLVLHRINSLAQLRQVLWAWLAGILLLAAHGIVQAHTGWGLPGMQLLSDQIYIGGLRGGSLYGATPQGGLMVLGLGAGLALLLSSQNRYSAACAALAVGLCVVAAVYTQTRASWLAMAFAFGLLFLALRKSPGVIALSVSALLLFAVFLGPIVLDRLSSLSFSKAEQSLYERLQYYTVAWHIFRSHPLLGLGWGCYYDIKSILVNHAYVAVPNFSERFDASASTVHSAYLQVLVKTGLIGLLSFLSFLSVWTWRALRCWGRRARATREGWAFIGLASGLFGYLLHCAGENFFQWPVMSMSFYLLFGCSTLLWTRLPATADADPS